MSDAAVVLKTTSFSSHLIQGSGSEENKMENMTYTELKQLLASSVRTLQLPVGKLGNHRESVVG